MEEEEEEVEEENETRTPSKSKNDKSRRISFASTILDTPGSGEFPVGRQVEDDDYSEPSDNEGDTTMDLDTSYSSTSKSYADSSFLRAARKQIYEDDDDNEIVTGAHSSDDSEENRGVRRSRRKYKGERVQFWKNERNIYVKGKMMGRLVANPTPAKPKRKSSAITTKNQTNKATKKRKEVKEVVKKLEKDSESEIEIEQEAPIILPKGVKYLNR